MQRLQTFIFIFVTFLTFFKYSFQRLLRLCCSVAPEIMIQIIARSKHLVRSSEWGVLNKLFVAAVAMVTGEAVCEQQRNPCLNGGRCLPLLGDYYCDCPFNATGRNCERSTFVVCYSLAY